MVVIRTLLVTLLSIGTIRHSFLDLQPRISGRKYLKFKPFLTKMAVKGRILHFSPNLRSANYNEGSCTDFSKYWHHQKCFSLPLAAYFWPKVPNVKYFGRFLNISPCLISTYCNTGSFPVFSIYWHHQNCFSLPLATNFGPKIPTI